jgi:serine/threonine protein kinase
MSVCPGCKEALAANQRFCGFCGAAVGAPQDEEEPAYFEEECTFAEDDMSFAEDDMTFAVMQRNAKLLDNRYELLEHIGDGGMGQVWRARDQWQELPVAVKLLTRSSRAISHSHGRLRDEYEAMSRVDHPGIVRVHGFGWAEIPNVQGGGTIQAVYYAMQLIPPPRLTLEQLITRGPLTGDEVLAIAGGLAEALTALAAELIVHCDLKPANVFVLEEQAGHRVVVADLGACRLPGHPPPRLVAGTPVYMAPEQIDEVLRRGEVAITCAADVWAFGVVLFELLTGNVFFPLPPEAPSLSQAAGVIREAMVQPYIDQRVASVEGLGPGVWELIRGCLRLAPGERIETGALLGALLAC